ncbi:MAG: ribulose-phosphate 3-epimerase [Rickettsiales bacterium]|nr:ribulose-phosphate 3-epimerase [Rickettsiales bacterium]
MSQIKISPSILSADFSRLGEEVEALCSAGADYIHVDVMDGHFVPNITIGSCVIEKIKKYSKVPLDVHLMIDRPDKYIKSFIDAGADILTVHAEAEGFSPSLIEKIKEQNIKAGIAISPSTSSETLDDLIRIIDLVLIMTVDPGFAGQKFLINQLKKICEIKARAKKLQRSDLLIAVDGGINEITAVEAIKAGANFLVSGSYILKSKKYAEKIKLLKSHYKIARKYCEI